MNLSVFAPLWLGLAGIPKPEGMPSGIFMVEYADQPGIYAISARDRIDETVIRQRSVREKKYHYIRNFTPGAGFPEEGNGRSRKHSGTSGNLQAF